MAVTAGVVVAGAAVAGTVSNMTKSSGSSGSSSSDAAGQQAEANAQEASQLWDNLQTPSYDTSSPQFQTWLQNYVPETYDPYVGQMTQMQDDTASLGAENQSLAQLQALSKGGLSPSDQVALQQLESSQAGSASSQAASAADALRARGLGGSGAEYASKLAANQNAANSPSTVYDNALKSAMDRQLQATTQAGTLAGNIRQQSDSVSNQMASISNAFNTQVQQLRTQAAANAANVRNQAQAANLAGLQSTANANVATSNANLQNQNSLKQQQFQNQESIISGKTNALNAQTNQALAQQAAANQQALGDSQQTQASLNGLVSAGKMFMPTTTGTTSTSSTPSWWNNVFGSSSNSTSGETGTWDVPDTDTLDTGTW
jgi:hypothetical protein